MKLRRSRTGWIVSSVVAVALLWVFLDHIAWRGIADGLRSARWTLVGAAVIVRVASFVVAALRWQLLLRPARPVPLRGVMAVTMMGAAASAVAPLQTAELIRPYLLSRRQGIELSATLATAAVEWLLDAAALMALFLPALALRDAHGHGGPYRVWLAVAAIGFVLASGGLVLLRRAPGWIEGLLHTVRWQDRLSATRRARIVERARSFATGLRTLDRPAGLIAVTAYSLLFFGLTALAAWLTLRAFDMPVSLVTGFLLLGLVTVAGMVPTPGAIGGFHAVCQMGLVTFFDFTRAQTVLPVIGLHAVLTLPSAILGVACFLASPLPSTSVR